MGAEALNATPFAALIMVFGLSSVSREELLAAKDLGARGARIARRILAPALVSTVFPSFVVASLMAASDVSASTVNAGPEPYLAPLARHALNASPDHSLALKILSLPHCQCYHGSEPGACSALEESIRLPLRSEFACARALRERLTRTWSSPRPGRARRPGAHRHCHLQTCCGIPFRLPPQTLLFNAARESFLVLLLVVPIAALIGFITALSNLRRMKALNSVALLGLLASPVTGGILVHIIHRRPLEFHGHVLLPLLVGGGSPAGGLIAVLIAYLLLALRPPTSSWFSRFQAPVMCVVPPRIRGRAERAPSFTSSSQ
ncbi:ABC transporter permease [Schaalia cardiffensis]|uniref:ABC transporter permease n=1 Tax=Schaalia cardiffensis TaxID=181487 RepID=UPI0038B9136F